MIISRDAYNIIDAVLLRKARTHQDSLYLPCVPLLPGLCPATGAIADAVVTPISCTGVVEPPVTRK